MTPKVIIDRSSVIHELCQFGLLFGCEHTLLGCRLLNLLLLLVFPGLDHRLQDLWVICITRSLST